MPKKKKGSGFFVLKAGRENSRGRHHQRLSSGTESVVSSGEESAQNDSSIDIANSSDTSDVFESACSSPRGISGLSSPGGRSGLPSPELSPRTDNVIAVSPEEKRDAVSEHKTIPEPLQVTEAVISETFTILRAVVPTHWKVIQDRKGFHVVCISRNNERNIAVQRVIYAAFEGSKDIFVHRKEILGEMRDDIMKNGACVPLTPASVKYFVDNVCRVVSALRKLEICARADLHELEDFWASDKGGKIDDNVFDESRYDKTFRSNECSLLVLVRRWRCKGCIRAVDRLKAKKKSVLEENFHASTRNDYLSESQMSRKLKELRKDLKNANRKIDYLQKKVTKLMNEESVLIDEGVGESLTETLLESKLTPIQQLFIQQQCKSSDCKNPKGMRWHPSLIRLALLFKSTSTAAYRALRNSGVIYLPGERTLYDYERAVPRSDGIFTDKLDILGVRVQSFEHDHQHFHSLLMDEIYISKKLVYRKCDGRLIGYNKLNEVESEVENLTESIQSDCISERPPEVATKILAYMVKGCTSSVKEVVAAFTTGTLTKEHLFSRTWEVIRACEVVGVKILAIVYDGSATNRGFIGMHPPASGTANDVVFDTVNLCALDRKIYFIADPPHLLKTIRNCFAKSGRSSNCTSLLTVDGEFIEWQTIVRLYLEDVPSIVRRNPKLNAQNVYLNSYTVMKVSYAAQVLSRTVGLDLQSRNWPGTASTVNFILKVNNFFDCLNGAHTSSGVRTANPRLSPYVSVDDPRFEELREFENYIRTWGEQVKNPKNVDDSIKTKMTLSSQTVTGIYMAINGFIGAMTYLLGVGAKFVNARVFCQDPLEQYFSKQRASGGGRHNVSADSFFFLVNPKSQSIET